MTAIPQWLIDYEEESLTGCIHDWQELLGSSELLCMWCDAKYEIPNSDQFKAISLESMPISVDPEPVATREGQLNG